MSYLKHLWLVVIILLMAFVFLSFVPMFYLAVFLALIWFGDFARRKSFKSILGLCLGLPLVLIGGYYVLAYYNMQDDVLNRKALMAKSCGDDMSALAPDFFICNLNSSCHFKDGTLIIPTRQGNTKTVRIVDRQWRFGQPVLYLQIDEHGPISRYCLK